MSPLGHPFRMSGSNAFACTAGRVLFMALDENVFGIEGEMAVFKDKLCKKFPLRQVPGSPG